MTPKEFITRCISKDMPSLDYRPIVNRLSNDTGLPRLIHAGIGMSGEAGEIVDQLKKSMMYGKELNVEHLKEECGDLLWYMSIMLHQINSSFEEVMQKNVDKLNKRYPTGFTEKDALERKDKLNKPEES